MQTLCTKSEHNDIKTLPKIPKDILHKPKHFGKTTRQNRLCQHYPYPCKTQNDNVW